MSIDFSTPTDTNALIAMIALEIAKHIKVKDGKLHFDKKSIKITLPGEKGDPGHTPVKGKDYRDGIDGKTPKKGVDYRDGIDGKTPKKGVDYRDGIDGKTPIKGKDYRDGKDARPPAHRWNGMCLSFRNPDGTWGDEIGLKGNPGEDIKGVKGDMPRHEWRGTLLRIENPDGSFSKWVDLKGGKGKGKKGDKGYTPKKGIDYFDGDPGENAELPAAKQITVLEDVDLVFIGPAMKPALEKKFQPIKVIEGN